MIVPPYPRLAGNNDNNKTPNAKAARTALHLDLLSPKKPNWFIIIVTAVVEWLVLIYTLRGSTRASPCIGRK
jgi:hypothetical protein